MQTRFSQNSPKGRQPSTSSDVAGLMMMIGALGPLTAYFLKRTDARR